MSIYYEAEEGDFELVKKDLEENKIDGIKIHQVKKEDLGFESEKSICITDGDNFLYIREGDVFCGLGLKKWGGNRPENMISILESKYDIKFISEEDMDLMHVG